MLLPSLKKTTWGILSISGLLLAATLTFHWDDLIWLTWKLYRTPATERAQHTWLPDYQLVREVNLALHEKDELSGLTWDSRTQSLWAVTGGSECVIEFRPDGQILRRIQLHGLSDLEGIEVLPNGQLSIVDERERLLAILPPLQPDTHTVHRSETQSYDLGFPDAGNKGFEGLGWSAQYKQLFLVKERDPLGVFSFVSPSLSVGTEQLKHTLHTHIPETRLPLRDLSSFAEDPHSRNWILLSDESRMLLEVTPQGEPISFIKLYGGFNGLSQSIRQAEGIAFDEHSRLYLVGEPNRLYVFERLTPDTTN